LIGAKLLCNCNALTSNKTSVPEAVDQKLEAERKFLCAYVFRKFLTCVWDLYSKSLFWWKQLPKLNSRGFLSMTPNYIIFRLFGFLKSVLFFNQPFHRFRTLYVYLPFLEICKTQIRETPKNWVQKYLTWVICSENSSSIPGENFQHFVQCLRVLLLGFPIKIVLTASRSFWLFHGGFMWKCWLGFSSYFATFFASVCEARLCLCVWIFLRPKGGHVLVVGLVKCDTMYLTSWVPP